MYQSEMKEGFIEDYLRSRFVARTSLNSLFKKTEPFEKENGKDCSQFNENEILYKELENAHARDSNDKYFRWVYRKVRNCRDHVGMPGLTMKNIQTSGMYYYLCRGIQETGLDLRSFLKSEDGECLMDKYGFQSKYRVDNVYHHFQDYI
jgi:hypothetical protein